MGASSALMEKAARVRYLLLDVDGVMTNGVLYIDAQGRETKGFSIYDGHGILLLQKAGMGIGIVSGSLSASVECRAKDLGIEDLYQGAHDKLPIYEMLLAKHHLSDGQVAYIGDDVIDLPILKRVGLSVAVPNAVDQVKSVVDWVTKRRGGDGAVREVVDLILLAQGHL